MTINLNDAVDTATINFTTCLFRLANLSKDSIMCIEIARVRLGEITHKQYWLINPECEFDSTNQAQREFLTVKDLETYPTFPEIWEEVKQYFDDQIVVTQNTSHVLNMLFYTLDKYQLEYPNFIFYDSKKIIGRSLLADTSESEIEMIQLYEKNGPKFRPLDTDAPYDPMLFAEKLGLKYEYGLGNFAIIIAEAMLKVFEVTGIQSFSELEKELGCFHGYTKNKDYYSCKSHESIKHEIDYKEIQKQAVENINITKCVYTGKKILFTGKMKNLIREEIVHLAAKFGIIPQESVTKSLNIVVIGENPGPSKIDKIAKINTEGGGIVVMTEDKFLQSIK